MSVLKGRDWIILLVSCFVVLLSFSKEGGYSFQSSWYVAIDTNLYENQHYPQESKSERLPAPLITDVDGDGLNEVVLVTPDYRIKIIDGSASTQFNSQVSIKAEATLLPSFSISSGRKPVYITSGYLTPYQEEKVRQQVIVVVTDGWSILCFDSKLNLVWESHAKDYLPKEMYHSEIAAIVTPKPIRKGDLGSVIVGGRMRSSFAQQLDHEHEENKEEEESEDEDQNLDEEEEMIMDETTHFSYFAFDGRTGAMRWKHERGDFQQETMHENEEEAEVLPEHSYRLHVLRSQRHTGEVDWRRFRENMLATLPHLWSHSYHTFFSLSHFQKRSQSGSMRRAPSFEPHDIGIPSEHIPGLPFGGLAPHSPSDHIYKPNVIVSHKKDGIEIIHLYDGRTVCDLELMDGLYADINGDGIIDRVQVLASKKKKKSSSQCLMKVTSGISSTELLFNASLCDEKIFVKNLQGPTKVADPCVIKSSSSSTLFYPSSKQGFNIVFLNSHGMVTCYSGKNGKKMWQLSTDVLWPKPKKRRRRRKDFNIVQQTDDILEAAVKPSLTSLTIEQYSDKEVILAVSHTMALISATGSVITDIDLKGAPLYAPVTGDFNNDGLTDVIVATPQGYFGYSIQPAIGSIILPILCIVLLMIMLFMFIYSRYWDSIEQFLL